MNLYMLLKACAEQYSCITNWYSTDLKYLVLKVSHSPLKTLLFFCFHNENG